MPAVTSSRPTKPAPAGMAALLATSCGTALASVSIVGLFQMERLLGGLWTVAAIIIAGSCCLVLARSLGRLAAVVPSGAGLLAYLARGFGRQAGLTATLPYLLLTLLVAGGEATIVGLLCTRLVGVPPLVAALVFLVMTWLVCRSGVRISLRVQAAATGALMAGLALLAVAALVQAGQNGKLSGCLLPAWPGGLAFVAGVGQAFFLFMGFELMTSQVEIVSRPAIVGRSLAASAVVLTGFYGLLAAGFSCLPEETGAGSGATVPQMALAEQHGGSVIIVLLVGLSMLASFASFHGAMLSLSRLGSALAAQGLLPRALARIEPRSLMPRKALLCLLGLAGLATCLLSNSGLMRPAILAASVAAAGVYAALAWVRERPPFAETGRPWLARGISGGLALVLVAVAVGVLIDAGPTLPVTLALVGISVVAALIVARRSRRPGRSRPRPAPLVEGIEHARG